MFCSCRRRFSTDLPPLPPTSHTHSPEGLFLVDVADLPSPDVIADEPSIDELEAEAKKARPKTPFFYRGSFKLDDAGNRTEAFDLYETEEEREERLAREAEEERKGIKKNLDDDDAIDVTVDEDRLLPGPDDDDEEIDDGLEDTFL